jgi:hypothetical protein
MVLRGDAGIQKAQTFDGKPFFGEYQPAKKKSNGDCIPHSETCGKRE